MNQKLEAAPKEPEEKSEVKLEAKTETKAKTEIETDVKKKEENAQREQNAPEINNNIEKGPAN